MGCCGKGKKIKNIVHGFTSLALEKAAGVKFLKCEYTDDRIRICQKCDYREWRGRTLWCKVCGCFVPAKARVANEKCEKGYWNNIGVKKN